MPRQQPIPVTTEERQVLNERKSLYERHTGDVGDWGHFLNSITLLGLAVAGVYPLVKGERTRRNATEVQCPSCEMILWFFDHDREGVLLVPCPACDTEYVAHFDLKAA